MQEAFTIVLDRLQAVSSDLAREREARIRAEQEVERAVSRKPSEQAVCALVAALADNHKIEAIKAFRELTGYGLKESKDAIETVTTRFVREAAGGSS